MRGKGEELRGEVGGARAEIRKGSIPRHDSGGAGKSCGKIEGRGQAGPVKRRDQVPNQDSVMNHRKVARTGDPSPLTSVGEVEEG